jgi:hypothetical protein
MNQSLLLASLLIEFRDSHLSSPVHTDDISWLGLSTDWDGSSVIVTRIEMPDAAGVSPGDQLLECDGKPVSAEIGEIAAHVGKSSNASSWRFAVMMLTERHGFAVPLKTGSARLTLLREGSLLPA